MKSSRRLLGTYVTARMGIRRPPIEVEYSRNGDYSISEDGTSSTANGVYATLRTRGKGSPTQNSGKLTYVMNYLG